MGDLIAEYERLRKVMHELTMQMNTVDARLIEIEKELPDNYKYPGDLCEEEINRLLSGNRPKRRLPRS